MSFQIKNFKRKIRAKMLGTSLPFNCPRNLKTYSKLVLDVKYLCAYFPVRIYLKHIES
jgi:hypothetical protein